MLTPRGMDGDLELHGSINVCQQPYTPHLRRNIQNFLHALFAAPYFCDSAVAPENTDNHAHRPEEEKHDEWKQPT